MDGHLRGLDWLGLFCVFSVSKEVVHGARRGDTKNFKDVKSILFIDISKRLLVVWGRVRYRLRLDHTNNFSGRSQLPQRGTIGIFSGHGDGMTATRIFCI